MATEAGVPQAVYPEGGLSVDGNLRAPKLGLLDYMLKEFRADGERDLVFIPVGINYDRVLEDRSLMRKLDGAGRRVSVMRGVMTAVGFVLHNLWLAITGRWYRFGYACVNFGTPISLRVYVREQGLDFSTMDDVARREPVERFGCLLMDEISAIVPVLPVSLVATVLMRRPDVHWSELELKSAASNLMEMLMESSAHIHVPRADRDYAIGVGLRMLTLRHVVLEEDGLYRCNPDDRKLIAYYANAIAPAVARALPSTE
jgi:glycerol-3-phosphate O-acyltransferase